MPSFPTQIVGTAINRRKARRYVGEKKGTMHRAPTKASAQPSVALPRRLRSRKWLRGDGDDAVGATGAADGFEPCSHDDRAGGRQLIEIANAGGAELCAAVHDELTRKGRAKR